MQIKYGEEAKKKTCTAHPSLYIHIYNNNNWPIAKSHIFPEFFFVMFSLRAPDEILKIFVCFAISPFGKIFIYMFVRARTFLGRHLSAPHAYTPPPIGGK